MTAPVPGRRFGNRPRIRVVEPIDPTITAIFQAHAARLAGPPPPEPAEETQPLARRLEAIKRALDNLPRQARRLVRWRTRREATAARRPVYTSPLRPGRAPYLPANPVREVDFVLERCHLLAGDALHFDTS